MKDTDKMLTDLIGMVEDAEKKRVAYGPGWLLREKLSPTFQLAATARALGVLGTIQFVESYFFATGCVGLMPARSLNLPRRFVDGCIKRAIKNRYRDARSIAANDDYGVI